MRTKATKPFVYFPVPILIDTREQLPYSFAGLQADASDNGVPLVVELIPGTLQAGDYSLLGAHHRVAIERKSKSDLFGTLGHGRSRFQRELERLAAYDFAAVVVEAEWSEILNNPPEHSRLKPKIVFRSVIAWQQRFPNVHWWFCCDRRHGEVTTLRILERWMKDQQRKLGDPNNDTGTVQRAQSA